MQPTHFPGDEPLLVGIVLILVQQLEVFVGARVAFAHQLLVVELVPFLVFPRLMPGRFERFAQLLHEAVEPLGSFALTPLFLLGCQRPGRRRNRELIIRAFDDDAAVELAEPFEIKAVGHVLRHWQFVLQPLVSLLEWNVEHANLARRREVANGSALQRFHPRIGPQRDRLAGIFKRQQTTRKVGTGVALEFEDHRFVEAVQPDFAAHDAALAIVDLTALHTVMNAPGHTQSFTTTGR